jgi:hypothetical protein
VVIAFFPNLALVALIDGSKPWFACVLRLC